MINRQEIKSKAKELIKPSYWKNVAAGLLLTVTTGASLAFASTHIDKIRQEDITELHKIIDPINPLLVVGVLGIALGITLAIVLGLVLLYELIALPLEVGCRGYFLRHREGDARMSECFGGFTGNFKNVYTTMLIRNIKIALWSLLFVVPGIVKHYEYKMVPYLLAKNPDMDRKAAFAISKSMMDGHKMDAFKLELSFIGWDILGVLTLGLVNVFYTAPYQAAADVEFFETVQAAA